MIIEELTFKSAHINSTRPVDIWTPAKGKRIRLKGYRIHAIGTVAHERTMIAELQQDNESLPFRQLLPVTNIKETLSHTIPSISLDRGYLMDMDKTLRIRISEELLHGFIDVLVWGCEESS